MLDLIEQLKKDFIPITLNVSKENEEKALKECDEYIKTGNKNINNMTPLTIYYIISKLPEDKQITFLKEKDGMNMALLQEWRDYAYKFDDRTAEGQQFWLNYFNIEKGIYEQLLADKDTVVSGTVKELADKYETELQMFVGFLDGINDSLKEANPIEEMDENTQVSLDIDFEKLYYNMVGCRAEWLYNLKEWDDILTEERRKELYKESRNSTTVVKGKKIGRNDPCPCGSGKKYKKCCGKNA